MGLQHVSEGLAHERHITVSKISSSPSQCMEATSLECESNDNLELASKQDSELVIEQESSEGNADIFTKEVIVCMFV